MIFCSIYTYYIKELLYKNKKTKSNMKVLIITLLVVLSIGGYIMINQTDAEDSKKKRNT
jgi:hypothetical protein